MINNSIPKVICLGEALVDRLGPLGVDPKLTSTDQCEDCFGGAPANVACCLARLGTSSAFLGRLGCDEIGQAFQSLFLTRAVDLSLLQTDFERPSRVVLVKRDTNGERSFHGFAGDSGKGFADQALELSQSSSTSLKSIFGKADWLQIGTIPLAAPLSAASLQMALDIAISQSVHIALDVNWRPTFWQEGAPSDSGPSADQSYLVRSIVEKADLLKLAAEEAQWFFNTKSPQEISTSLPKKPFVVVTDGSGPIAWFSGKQSGVMPSFKVDVLDSTGAGDAFLASLLHKVCLEPDLLKTSSNVEDRERITAAMYFANACGALVCMGLGAIDSQPIENEVNDFLRVFESKITSSHCL